MHDSEKLSISQQFDFDFIELSSYIKPKLYKF